MLENVRGLSSPKFKEYREWIILELGKLGYETFWDLILSSNFGVPQLRPRFVLVALKKNLLLTSNTQKTTTLGQLCLKQFGT